MGEAWKSVLEYGGGVGSVGKHGEVRLGGGERCEKCVGVGGGEEKCGQKWRMCEDVGRSLESVKKCRERRGVRGVGEGGKSVPHLSPHPDTLPTPFQISPTLSHTFPHLSPLTK